MTLDLLSDKCILYKILNKYYKLTLKFYGENIMRKKLLTMIVISILAIGNIGCVKEDIN